MTDHRARHGTEVTAPAGTPATTARELGRLAAAYPAFRFSREHVGRHGQCWVAERRDRMAHGVHTVITADIAELRAALSGQTADAEGGGHAR